MIEATFLHNPSGKDMFCHCPSIFETQSGALMVVWYVYPEDEHSGATLVHANKKHNYWSLAESILDVGKYSIGNPVLFQDPGRRIHLQFLVLKGHY